MVAAGALALWWWLPKWEVNRLRLKIRDPKARADVEDNFRKTIGQLLGGLAVLIGAGFAYYQTQRTVQASHDLLINQQISKGFEQLGSTTLVIRLGGIYALEGVMKTSDDYYQPVLGALCAFVREGATQPKDQSGPSAKLTPMSTDIQAALTVIGRRSKGGSVDLSAADLSAANLRDANLSDANLSDANLSDANLIGAHLSRANLSGANLRGTDLSTAELNSAFLISANLSAADLRDANLSGANLSGADLSNADLGNANLSGADLSNADLGNANLSDANLSGAHLSRANLRDANLSDANLSDANLIGAHLSRANLSDANLSGAKLSVTDLSAADLNGANLRDVKGITQDQLNEACGGGAKLPPGLTLKPCP